MVSKPTRPYRALRAGVGAVVLASVIALWAHGQVTGDPLGTMWDVVIVAVVIASGYAVFGRRTMSDAVDTAQDLSGTEEGDDGDA